MNKREIFKPRANMTSMGTYWQCSTDSRTLNRVLVCDGGPSLIWDNGRWEFFDSNLGYHRLDGPATSEDVWCINNKNVTDEIHEFAEENNIDLNNLTDEDKVLIALRFG